MDEDRVLSHLVDRSGIPDRVALRGALEVTLLGLRDMLGEPSAIHLAARLPEALAITLRGAPRKPAALAEIFERVHVATGLRRDAACEATQCCLGLIGALLAEDDRGDLIGRLPAEWATHLERVDPSRTTVDAAHGLLGQNASIAASDDPHRDTRLSSAPGLRGTTLADAASSRGDRGLADAGPSERALSEGAPGAGRRSLAEARSSVPPRVPGRRT